MSSPDLRVTWTEVLFAAHALEATTAEAGSLPRTTYRAYEDLDMSGSPLAAATAGFLQRWAVGLSDLEEAGRGLHTWLLSAVEELRAIDAALAAADG